MEQWFATMKEQWYTYGTEPLNHKNLQQFYLLYQKYIHTKKNAKISDLIDIYTSRIDNWEKIYIWYIKKWTHLLWWGIFINKVTYGKRWLVLWFRAFESDVFNKLSIGYYIEYLFFLLGLELGIEVFTRWSDRNGYGLSWSSVGLAIHKVQLHFIPYLHENNKNRIEVDPISIQQETIIFSQNNTSSDVLHTVNIWTSLNRGEAEKQYNIFTKRWFDVNFFDILPLFSKD